MKEIKTLSDDPQFKEASDAVERCQLELLKIAERSSEIESEILALKDIVLADDAQWNRFKAGGTIDTNARSRIALRTEQGDLQQRQAFLSEALEHKEESRSIRSAAVSVSKFASPIALSSLRMPKNLASLESTQRRN